jgi:protein gp37
MLSDNHWKEPFRWNRAAEKAGERRRVLVSMCDPFEDLPPLLNMRYQFLNLICATPSLDWLLWTKRPRVAAEYYRTCSVSSNVWLGVSCSTQKDVDEMIPVLLEIPASVRAVSLEPLIEAVDVKPYLSTTYGRRLSWVIVGGESGSGRRKFSWVWAANIQSQCRDVGVPFYMKQDSHFRPGQQGRIPDELWGVKEVPKARET